jgi:iron-sulfur cluster assembly protein
MDATLNFVENPETATMPAVSMTENGQKHIARLMNENDMKGFGLRFGVQGGGCSGYSYLLEFEEAPQDDDDVHTFGDVRVFVNPLHLQYVRGSVIDFKDELIGAGFHIENPNVKRKCGCGSSFDV